MKINTIKNSELVKSVQRELKANPNRRYFQHVTENILGKRRCYLWGGVVRDPIIRQKYGGTGYADDIDILVDDSQEPLALNEIFKGEKNARINRAGTITWEPTKSFRIDVSKFSDANRLREAVEQGISTWKLAGDYGTGDSRIDYSERVRNYPISLETCLVLSDFNTSAIAYGLKDKTIYEYKALEGINRKEIDLLENAIDVPHIMMLRLVLHSSKFGFSLGPRALKFIVANYSPQLDKGIKHYLQAKRMKEKINFVIMNLRTIKASNSCKLINP